MDLGELQTLCDWMRRAGVVHARIGELELRLGPQPLPVGRILAEAPTPSDDDEERHSLETLLYSSGAVAGPIAEAMRRMRERSPGT